MSALPVLSADLNFDAAAHLVLAYLRDHVPLAEWAVTRVENGRQTYMFLDEDTSGLTLGGSNPWEDTFCIRMVSGAGPTVAPDAQSIPAYAAAEGNKYGQVGAYAGAVISEPGGELFGVICGFDPEIRSDSPAVVEAAPLLQLLGQLLSMVLAADRARERDAEVVLLAQLAAETDVLTGLYNRRAWERVIAQEESRFRRFADPTVAVVLDLDALKTVNDTYGHAAGDEYIRRAAAALLRTVRTQDAVARLGGDEFGVLMRGCTEVEAADVVGRLYAAFDATGVAGSVGWAPITVLRGFPAALAEADAAMYVAKAERRARRTTNDSGTALSPGSRGS